MAARDTQLALFTAWHVEAFARQKRLPKLKALLEARPRPAETGPSWTALRARLEAYQARRDHLKSIIPPQAE